MKEISLHSFAHKTGEGNQLNGGKKSVELTQLRCCIHHCNSRIKQIEDSKGDERLKLDKLMSYLDVTQHCKAEGINMIGDTKLRKAICDFFKNPNMGTVMAAAACSYISLNKTQECRCPFFGGDICWLKFDMLFDALEANNKNAMS